MRNYRIKLQYILKIWEKKIDNGIKCQCCPAFPKKQLENMKTNKIQDIHDFDHNVLMNLRWTCPRTKKDRKRSLLHKKITVKKLSNFRKKVNTGAY